MTRLILVMGPRRHGKSTLLTDLSQEDGVDYKEATTAHDAGNIDQYESIELHVIVSDGYVEHELITHPHLTVIPHKPVING